MSKTDPTQFLYSSARVRAMERGLVGRDKLERLIEARSYGDALSLLGEFGLETPQDASPAALERVLSAYLNTAYTEIASAAPDFDALRLFRYPYDNNNVKSALKCAIRGLDPAECMMSGGTVPPEALIADLSRDKSDRLPPHMAAAVNVARETYARTKNPQQIDFIMDRACFADMKEAAIESGVAFLVTLVETKIDLTNLMILIRILRMNLKTTGGALLSDALLPGGTISEKTFMLWYRDGAAKLSSQLALTPYAALGEALLSDEAAPLYRLERICDDIYTEKAADARYVAFGPEILVGYLAGAEMSVKNMRMILAGKAAGQSPGVIRERVRASYV